MANIAEGFGRGGNAEFLQFLSVAKGSANEVKAHLYVALDQNYVAQQQFDSVQRLCDETISLIVGLMLYLKRSNYKGAKHR
jgi:four helix bundle protein